MSVTRPRFKEGTGSLWQPQEQRVGPESEANFTHPSDADTVLPFLLTDLSARVGPQPVLHPDTGAT